MKDIFLIDAYPHTENSKRIFIDSMSRVKSMGFKICLITNLKPTSDILDAVNYCFYDEEDRKFSNSFEEYPNITVFSSKDNVQIQTESEHTQKHSLSVHSNMYRGFEILKTLGYTHCYRMEYDSLIHPDDMDKVKSMPDALGDKKAIFYLDKNNKHIFYHIWYCNIEWMLSNFTKIRNEEDYIKRVVEITGKKKFLPAEEFLAEDLKNKYDEVILLETVDGSFNSEFPNTRWNNIISDHTNEKFKKGFYGGIFKVALRTENGLHIKGNKGAIVAWNIGSLEKNWTDVTFFNKDGQIDKNLKLELNDNENWTSLFFEFTDDCEVEIKLSNGIVHAFLLCKEFLIKTKDTIIINEDSSN